MCSRPDLAVKFRVRRNREQVDCSDLVLLADQALHHRRRRPLQNLPRASTPTGLGPSMTGCLRVWLVFRADAQVAITPRSNHHCATCNAGYYMHGHHCKAHGRLKGRYVCKACFVSRQAYSCTTGRARLCGSCVAQHQRTVRLQGCFGPRFCGCASPHVEGPTCHARTFEPLKSPSV